VPLVRRYGHIPDAPGVSYAPLHGLVGAGAPATSADLTPHVSRVLDQGGTSACVGMAFAAAIAIRASAAGVTIPFPSAMGIYALARQIDDPNAYPIPDEGSQPSAAVRAMNQLGIVAESRWPQDVDPVDPVPFDVLKAGCDAVLTGSYGIIGSGPARLALIKQALTSGYPVTFAMPVDRAYEDIVSSATYMAGTAIDLGTHCQTIVGYRDDYQAVRVLNSWGAGWGDRGYAWVSYAWMQSDRLFDFNVLTAAPAGVH
jgi:hypothetical protein